MELELLLILVVAFLVFGPEKMLEFATQLGRIVRQIKKEWASIQLEAQMAQLKEELKKQTLESEQKVKAYLSGEDKKEAKTQKEILNEILSQNGDKEENKPKKEGEFPTLEELARGEAPLVEPSEENPKSVDNKKFS